MLGDDCNLIRSNFVSCVTISSNSVIVTTQLQLTSPNEIKQLEPGHGSPIQQQVIVANLVSTPHCARKLGVDSRSLQIRLRTAVWCFGQLDNTSVIVTVILIIHFLLKVQQ